MTIASLSTPQIASTMPPIGSDVPKAATTNLFKMPGSQTSLAKIDAIAQDFESQFVSQMLSSMFSTTDIKDGLGGSEAEETYQSMMVNEYGKILTRTGGFGVAAQIKRHLLNLQEVES